MAQNTAWSESIETITLPSAGSLSGAQYKLVNVNVSGGVQLATSGAQAIGVLYNKPGNIGDPATIVFDGIVKCYVGAGAAVAAGVEVCADSGGMLITAANTSGAGGQAVVGRTLSAATAGAVVSILFNSHKAQLTG